MCVCWLDYVWFSSVGNKSYVTKILFKGVIGLCTCTGIWTRHSAGDYRKREKRKRVKRKAVLATRGRKWKFWQRVPWLSGLDGLIIKLTAPTGSWTSRKPLQDLKVPVWSHFCWKPHSGSFLFRSCFSVKYTLPWPYEWMKIPQLSDFANCLISEF